MIFNFCLRTTKSFATSFLLLVLSGYVSAQSIEKIQSDHLLKVDLLYVGAHPDDESGVTATLAREVLDGGARAGIVLVTRGEGGGNAIGRELGPSLGILREAELRRSADEYGVDLVYFLDKTDFFYTLSDKAVFDVWGHNDTLRRLVRLVRLLRPEVIVTMWPGPGTHGMHQAAARLATEAFTVAADPNKFPKQIEEEFLRTWQPLKLYYNTRHPGAITIPTGDISASRFLSYAEIKSLALRNFRSQGFDRSATLPPQRARAESFLLVRTLVPNFSNETNTLLSGIGEERDMGIVLAPMHSLEPMSISMVPRTDIVRFRSWAEEHQVAWAAGMLPAAISIGAGMAGTLKAELINRASNAVEGRVTLTLPDGWSTEPIESLYTVPSFGRETVSFNARVPDQVEQGTYKVEFATAINGEAIIGHGEVDVLPVMDLAQAPSHLLIDGELSDWEGIQTHIISSENLWSGLLPGGDNDCSAVLRAAYDEKYLYTVLDVRDDVVVCNIAPTDIKSHWRSDAVEICVDPSGRSENTLTVFKAGIFPGTTQGRDSRAVRDADAKPGIIEKTAPGMRVASKFTGSGYIIETAIPWSDMPGGTVPNTGEILGFNVVIYDGDDTEAGTGANIGKARLAWSYRPSAQALPYYYGRARVR